MSYCCRTSKSKDFTTLNKRIPIQKGKHSWRLCLQPSELLAWLCTSGSSQTLLKFFNFLNLRKQKVKVKNWKVAMYIKECLRCLKKNLQETCKNNLYKVGEHTFFLYFSMSCLLPILPVRSQKPEYPCIIRNFLCDLDNKNKYLHVKNTSVFILF